MQGIKRKVVYVGLYEGIAVGFNSLVIYWLGHDISHAGVAAALASGVAILWNLAWNTLFEAWEGRQRSRERTVARRVLHALGFEGGLVVILVPVFAWLLGVSLVEALTLDLGLLVFFLVYTYVFTWGFDAVFGAPRSAQVCA